MPGKTYKESGSLYLVCGDEELAIKERSVSIFGQWKDQFPEYEEELIDAAAGNAGEAAERESTAVWRTHASLQVCS